MAVIQVNYDPEERAKAAQGGGRLMPEGWYVLRITSAEGKPGKEGKHPLIECKCEIISSFNQQNIGGVITRRFSLAPKSVPYNLERFLRAAGIHYQDQGGGAIVFDDQYLPGAVTKVTCKHTPGEQRTFENWDNDEPYEQGGVQRPVAFQQPMQGPPQQMQGQAPWQAPPAQQFQPMQGQPMQQPQQYVPPAQPTYPQPAPVYPQQNTGGFPQQPMQQPQYPQQYVQPGPATAPPQNGQQPPPQGWPSGAWQPQPNQGR